MKRELLIIIVNKNDKDKISYWKIKNSRFIRMDVSILDRFFVLLTTIQIYDRVSILGK